MRGDAINDSINNAVNQANQASSGISTIAIVGIIAGVLITVVVLFFVFRLLRGVSRSSENTKRLLATGTPAQAKVLNIAETGTRINDNPVCNILLEVQPPGGAPYQAQIKQLVSIVRLGSLQPGNSVPVRIDPANAQNIAIAMA